MRSPIEVVLLSSFMCRSLAKCRKKSKLVVFGKFVAIPWLRRIIGDGRGPLARHFGDMRKKSDLPSKTCPVCQRPFSWRKKWARHWDEVVYCSERCRRERGKAQSRLSVSRL